uniref:Telomerase RNA component interacting RNase n=1 Tax=Paramormyrops kingsleyae TaxID=1676925 RepID=A0A3B3S5V0_9TELE
TPTPPPKTHTKQILFYNIKLKASSCNGCSLLSPTTQVGKRRGGAKLALKTGMVAKKQKLEPEVVAGKGDAWTKYMAEVKKYKAHQCGDDDKTRPLVK